MGIKFQMEGFVIGKKTGKQQLSRCVERQSAQKIQRNMAIN